MSASQTQLTEIITRVSTVLGATFTEHTRGFDIPSLDSNELENGYSVIYQDASEDVGQKLSQLVVTRPVIISITYRTFAHAKDNKTKSVYSTVLENEEDIVFDLRTRALTNGRLLDMISMNVSTLAIEGDSFLLNEIVMNTFYNVTS
jgi:hypothetical protein